MDKEFDKLFSEPQGGFSQNYCDNLPFDERLNYVAKYDEYWTRHDSNLFELGIINEWQSLQKKLDDKDRKIAILQADLNNVDFVQSQINRGDFSGALQYDYDNLDSEQIKDNINTEIENLKYDRGEMILEFYKRVYAYENVDISQYPVETFSRTPKDRDGNVNFITSKTRDVLGSGYKEYCDDKFSEKLAAKKYVHKNRRLPENGEELLDSLSQDVDKSFGE